MRKDFQMAIAIHHHHLDHAIHDGKQGFWSHLLEAIKTSRLERVAREMPSYLRTLDDETLQRVGFSTGQIKQIRARAVV
jgi:hypothetical protein